MSHAQRPWRRAGTFLYQLNNERRNCWYANVMPGSSPKKDRIAVAIMMQAAPDMLKALETVVAMYCEPHTYEDGSKAHEMAKQAIKKARGEVCQ